MNGSGRKLGSLGRPTRLGLYLVSLGVWISGGLWLLLHYFFSRHGEFGPEVNPFEPWSLKMHGAFAVSAIWMFGLLWSVHVTKLWPLSWRRWSGGLMAGVAAWLIVSGYLLYYVGDDKARSVVSLLHWGIGLAAPLFFFWHRITFPGQLLKRLLSIAWSRKFPPGKTRWRTKDNDGPKEDWVASGKTLEPSQEGPIAAHARRLR